MFFSSAGHKKPLRGLEIEIEVLQPFRENRMFGSVTTFPRKRSVQYLVDRHGLGILSDLGPQVRGNPCLVVVIAVTYTLSFG